MCAVGQLLYPRSTATLAVGRFNGVGQALAFVFAAKLHAIDDDLNDRRARERRHVDLIERDGLAAQQQSTEAAAAQRVQRV